MDRIWAESQLELLWWRAGNTTNSSTVSASAQAEMGSTKVEAASNEQLLPFLIEEENLSRHRTPFSLQM